MDGETAMQSSRQKMEGGEVARQTCTVGSRTGGWRRKETWGQQVPLAERESEIEGDRNRERERDEVSARLAG